VKPSHIVALVVIALCFGVTMFSFTGAVAQRVTIAHAISHPAQVLHVPGKIVKESVAYTVRGGKGQLRFDVVDPKDAAAHMTIVYNEPKPENFDTATSVEATGQYKDGVFEATNLLVKCPSKYRDGQEPKG